MCHSNRSPVLEDRGRRDSGLLEVYASGTTEDTISVVRNFSRKRVYKSFNPVRIKTLITLRPSDVIVVVIIFNVVIFKG